ncbi:EF-hand domain [Macleaya cordata]|uniref:EF-hand domain n=1 Tax=Macleaya cordata TaxID=56857 RepID=A0A200QVP6_MACCD|nr:EF-hand domain [Macleaya cordata]
MEFPQRVLGFDPPQLPLGGHPDRAQQTGCMWMGGVFYHPQGFTSGLYGSKETAQDAVTTGICILAGSTVMLLTLLWGSCLAFGSLDLSAPSKSSPDHQLLHHKKPLSLTGYGVATDVETSYTAVIMILSIIPFIIVHLTQFCGLSSWGRISVLFSLIVSVTFLFIYCVYQVFQPWIQNRRLEFLLDKYMEKAILKKLLGEDGIPKVHVIKELFHKIDQNNDAFVTLQELRGLILGIQFEEIGLKEEDYLEKVLAEFDTSNHDHRISENEFVEGIYRWLSKTKQSVYKQDRKRRCQQNPSSNISQIGDKQEEQEMLLNKTTEKVSHRDIHGVENVFGTFVKAAALLLLGTGILGLFAAPLIDAVQNFSTAANINPFLISFVILPLAINYREATSAITSAHQKKEHSASLTFSEIYSAVFMNNIVGVSIFLGIIYAQGLTWNFSAEVLVVLIVCVSMGLVGCFCITLHLWEVLGLPKGVGKLLCLRIKSKLSLEFLKVKKR